MAAAVLARPRTLDEAISLLAADPEGARPLGGGTAIQILRRGGLIAPTTLVDLADLPDLQGLGVDGEDFRIGAMVTQRTVEQSLGVGISAPLLRQVYRRVANVRVRHTATVGGNLAHGDYRLDPPGPLLVLGARVTAAGPKGRRTIPLRDFFVDLLQTALEPAEILLDVRVPLCRGTRTTAFHKFSSLAANDWPCVSVAAAIEWDDAERPAALRLGVTAMAATPLLVEIDSPPPDEADAATAAADAVLAVVDPIADVRGSVAYKRRVCAAVVRDAVATAWHARKEGGLRL
jgi:carbon-monoxide dehydrogenase medium subunit